MVSVVAAGNQRRGRLDRRHALAALGLLVLLAVVALAEGDLPELLGDLSDLRGLPGLALRRFGAPASFVLLYLEESGVLLPVPGDVYVVYLGSHYGRSLVGWVAAWLGVIAVVVAGSTNLYFISRRWGHRLVRGRLGAFLHLEPERLDRAEKWFARWGALAVIFGRHVPGFRIPITVASGIFEVPYRVFAPSVAVSTAIWAAAWLTLGARFGDNVRHFFELHRWTYLLLAGGVVALAVLAVIQYRRAAASRKS
jgi:membrane protein DedA with SNARE-associated domain